MTPDEYAKKYKSIKLGTLETGRLYAEVSYFSAIGRVLDVLRRHLKFGVNLNKDLLLSEMGEVLRQFMNLSDYTMSHGVLLFHDWNRSREMVPAGISGCANSMLNMINAIEPEKRIHFFANACSHMGFTFDDVAQSSLDGMENSGTGA